ncbi:MAG: Ku protein [Syntrophothermus sp.]
MRPIWTGSIGFGLVNIPVKIYSAIESSSLDLDMLDKKDHANIKFKRVNEHTGKEVPYENIVKGYLYEGQYIILEDQDFENANAKKTKVIEVNNFVNKDEIDTIYFENPYYLAPDKSGERAYFLLKEALLQSKKVGLGTFVMRNKENLAVIIPTQKILLLQRIHFPEEIRNPQDLNVPEKIEVKKPELKIALSLIDQLTSPFDISQYHDTYTAELMKVIEQKARGIKPKTQKLKVVHQKSQDLMEQLKASLNQNQKRKKVS